MRAHEIAMKHVGVPFRHRGRSPASKDYAGALDCVGLLVIVAQEMGLQYYDKKHYGREPWKDGLRETLVKNCGQPTEPVLAIDNILLFRLHPHEEPSHVGIVAPHRHGFGIVHTHGIIGRVVFQRIDEYRSNQIVEAYAWPTEMRA